ncbi:fatty acyl-AMP ligase [Sciscionella sediminilitoris]|uniref:fatty acyl-AMP ligase n=1 Tax=Sciscionella sediminilitoris TaxID=1445613 RepID=UPI0004DF54ED|nr:fatty acyl-AMP ligase [Sciscionella sp. SE31]
MQFYEAEIDTDIEPLTEALTKLAAGEGTAFTFIDYGTDADGIEHSISWYELDRRARAVAAKLGELTDSGERVALLCPQNLDYVIGFYAALYAGTISVPLFAPEASAHGQRLVGALADADSRVWLTSSESMDAVRELRDNQPVPRPKHLLAVDTVDSALADDFEPVPRAETDPAYLQYTSGSTRSPAGAVITRRAVAANVAQVRSAYAVGPESTCVGWLPFFHDMGLVQLVCLPVAAGCPCLFTTPFSFTRKPVRWLRLLSRAREAITAAPNFAFEYAAAKLTDADRAELDLSGVRTAINGSEPVRSSTIAGFQQACGPLGFAEQAHRPSYGLAEATVFVTASQGPHVLTADRERLGAGALELVQETDDRAISLVSAGKPVGQLVRIVDAEHGAVLDEGSVGEIWVHGPNVADGFWRQPERSTETFGGTLAEPGELPGTGWLRTGDLGVFHEGRLYITGRVKDLIIIDGKNHYPQDIEATVQEAHPAIRRDRLAVFSIERDGKEGPVVVAEFSQHVPEAEREPGAVAKKVRAAVARHHDLRLLDFRLVPPGTVRRTSSGKIARAATRTRYLEAIDAAENGRTA